MTSCTSNIANNAVEYKGDALAYKTENVPAFQFSIISCHPSLRLVKTIYTDKKDKPYNDAKHFRFGYRETNSFNEFADILLWLAGEPCRSIIRGQLLPGLSGYQRRLILPDKKNGDPATIVCPPRRWIPLDLDGVEVPEGLGAPDKMVEAAYFIRDHLLPPMFQKVRCVATATASTGRKGPTIARLRLFFKLSEAADNDALLLWIKALWRQRPDLDLDPRVMLANQIIFTGRPIFDGCTDPVPADCRVGALDGCTDEVSLSSIDIGAYAAQAKAKAKARAKAEKAGPKVVVCHDAPDWMLAAAEADGPLGVGPLEPIVPPDKPSNKAWIRIRHMFAALDGCRAGARHDTLNATAYELACLVKEGELPEALAREAYAEAAKGINNGDGKYDAEDIQRRIDDAFADR
jgi:hypothetical protein